MQAPQDWSKRPLTLDQHSHKVFAEGKRGQIWNPDFILDRRDDGALTVTLHADSPRDGLLVTLAINTDQDVSLDPIEVVVDSSGHSYATLDGEVICERQGARFPRQKPAQVWLRFYKGRLWVGFGNRVGQNTIMQGHTSRSQELGGGYQRFAVGKTANTGAFELLDVAPLERRQHSRMPW